MEDPSTWIAIGVGVAFAVLIVMVVVRMARKRPRVELPEEEEVEEAPSLPAPEPKLTTPVPARPGETVPAIRRAEAVPAKAPVAVEAVLLVPIPKARPLARGLEKTRREGFVGRLKSLFGGGRVDDTLISQAEEALLTADVGVATSGFLLDAIRNEFRPEAGDAAAELVAFLKGKVIEILGGLEHGAPVVREPGPTIIMVAGVNGTGKTTTIGKMAHFFASQGRKVILAAGDTYRAAGMDQLAIWGERVGVPVVVGKDRADPASVIFEAARRAKDEGFDILVADTAGRLHTNVNLVDELKKVHKVLGKVVPGAPHETLLVLDATMGQNAVKQAEIFRTAVSVTGIALAKLDGTAKGGVVLSIVRDMRLPIRFVGVGEGIDDLRPFDASDFADALFDED